MTLTPTSRRWRVGDHTRGLILDANGGTILVPVVVTAVARRSADRFAVECTYSHDGTTATRVYFVDDNGHSDSLSAIWPRETQRGYRHADFYPRDVHVPPLLSTEHIPFEDKTIAATYRLGNAVWHISEADSGTGDAFGWAEIAPGYGEWGAIHLPELEAARLEMRSAVGIVHRDPSTHGQRFADHIPHH